MKKKSVNRRHRRASGVGDRIIEGLTELRDSLRDGVPLARRFTVRTVEIAAPEKFSPARVRALRERLELSQALFAALAGVSTVLIQSWEQGSREPSPLARRLLTEMERDPRHWRRMILAGDSAVPRARRSA